MGLYGFVGFYTYMPVMKLFWESSKDETHYLESIIWLRYFTGEWEKELFGQEKILDYYATLGDFIMSEAIIKPEKSFRERLIEVLPEKKYWDKCAKEFGTDYVVVDGVRVSYDLMRHIPFMTVEDLFTKTDNNEVRRVLTQWYPGKMEGVIRDGGGETIKEATNVFDYQYARLVRMEIDRRSGPEYILVLIDRTPQKDSHLLSEEMRLERGLTKEGFRVYTQMLPPRPEKEFEKLTVYDLVGETFGFQPGFYCPDVES